MVGRDVVPPPALFVEPQPPPAAAERGGLVLPRLIVDAGPAAVGETADLPASTCCHTARFRSSFRDLAVEETDHPREVIEAALAHVVQNKVEGAYARSDLFERRRRLMDDWAASSSPAPADHRPALDPAKLKM